MKRKEFEIKQDAYAKRLEGMEARRTELLTQRAERQTKAKAIDRFIGMLKKRKDLLTKFDSVLWLTSIENATVHRDGSMTFRFNSGTEITI